MEVRFLTNEADEDEGLNHPGIEHYMGAPYAGIARECGQNSRDAKTGDPVRISIRCLDIPTGSIPGFDRLRASIDLCLTPGSASERRGEKPQFFENARKVAAAPTVKVLEVSDSNTTGLLVTAYWNQCVRRVSKGYRRERRVKTDDSGGSFSIRFDLLHSHRPNSEPSSMRPYATTPAGKPEFRFQGKSILTSHQDAKR